MKFFSQLKILNTKLFKVCLGLIISLLVFYLIIQLRILNDSQLGSFSTYLGACATFFAAFVAWDIAKNWKEQKNAEKLSEYSKEFIELDDFFGRDIFLKQQNLIMLLDEIKKMDLSVENSAEYKNAEKRIVELYIENDEINLCFYYFEFSRILFYISKSAHQKDSENIKTFLNDLKEYAFFNPRFHNNQINKLNHVIDLYKLIVERYKLIVSDSLVHKVMFN